MLLVSLALAAYGGLVLLDLLAREEVRTVRTLAMPADRRLAIETDSGDVSVVAAAGAPRIELRTQSGLFGAPALRVAQGADGRVSVETSCGAVPGLLGCSGELRVLVEVADLIIRSALERHESRGLHYTLDYPEMSPEAVDTVLVH